MFTQSTINAQTIINEVMAAHAIAPKAQGDYRDEYACFWPRFTPWGFDDLNESDSDYPTSAENAYSALIYELMTDATSELNDIYMVPNKIKFQTAPKGFHTINNDKRSLQRFADLVRKNAAAFGGGIIRETKAKPAVSWPSKLLSLFKASVEDKDWQAAFDLGEQLGAMYYPGANGGTFMQVAPVPCEFDARLVSAMNQDGSYAISEPVSMKSVSGCSVLNKKSRAAQIEHVLAKYSQASDELKNNMFAKAYATPEDQESARAKWMIEHGIETEAMVAARVADHERMEFERAEFEARQDVAEVVASAMATIAISEAMADTAESELCEACAELVTCEAEPSQTSEVMTGSAKSENFADVSGSKSTFSALFGLPPTAPAVEIQATAPAMETGPQDVPETLESFDDTSDGITNELIDAIECATAEQVQALTGEQFQRLYNHLENWNFHTENYMLEALRIGDASIIADMRQIAKEQAGAGGLGGELYERRKAVTGRMRAAKQAQEVPAATAPEVPRAKPFDIEACVSVYNSAGYLVSSQDPEAPRKITGILDLLQQQCSATAIDQAKQENDAPAVTAPEVPAFKLRPTVASKSGNWCAWFILTQFGQFGLTFDNIKANTSHASTYATASERMKALQAMAKAADAPDDTPPAGSAETPETADSGTAASPPAAVSSEAPMSPAAVSSGFERVKNVRVNLADMLADGTAPESLIGLGVYCSGDMANQPGSGAITAIGHSEWYGLTVDVTLESGYIWKSIRTREFNDGWFSLNGKTHGAPYLAELAAKVAMEKASESAAADQKANAHAKDLIDLAAQYPQLKLAKDNPSQGGKLAAANVRILLKQAFKGIKFSVTSDYSKVWIEWTDGPTDGHVNDVVGMFDIGASDSQSDYFYTVSTAFSDLFGGVQYMTTKRNVAGLPEKHRGF